MLYHLLFPLTDHVRGLNLFRYLTFRFGGALVTALIVSFVLGPRIIAWLKRKQREGQPIRIDGPESHLLTKKGTPTMGGVLILLALTSATLLWADLTNPFVWVALIVTIGYGGIGFCDDYLKLTRRSSGGLPGRLKLLGQAIIGLIAAFIIMRFTEPRLATSLAVPVMKNVLIPLGALFPLWGALVMMGSSNAVNLTDGLDGLAIVPVMITAVCFALISYLAGNSIFAGYLGIPYVPGTGELAVFCGGIVGASLGFLWFNAPPAMVFMGDTGSLSTGGAHRGRRRRGQARAGAADRGRPVRPGGGLGHRPGRLLQAHRPARVPHGAAPPPLREAGLEGAHHRHPLLDHRHDPGPGRPLHPEAAVSGMGALDRYRGKRVGILGLARSGLAAARALRAAGADVLAYDDKPDALARASAQGLEPGSAADVPALALLVPSPGVPLTHPAPHPVIAAAFAAGVPIRGDVDLFAEAVAPRRIVGITGTNGKSTTTALVRHLLAEGGLDAVRGGNIGEAVFDLDPGPDSRVFVLELSSFQLDLCETLRPAVAVWLNLTPDHLDRHGDLAGYAAAKARIFRNQQAGDRAVIGVDDDPSREVADRLEREGRSVTRVSVGAVPRGGVGVRDGWLVDALDGAERPVLDLRALERLRGRHNHQNAAVAYAAAQGTRPLARAGRPRLPELRRACRTGWRRWRRRAGSGSSTTARRPTPTRPRARSNPSTRSSGSPAASPSPAASRACGRRCAPSAAPS